MGGTWGRRRNSGREVLATNAFMPGGGGGGVMYMYSLMGGICSRSSMVYIAMGGV